MSLRIVPQSIRGKAVLGSGLVIVLFGLGIGLGAYVVVTQAALSSATTVLEARVQDVADQLSEQGAADPGAVDLEDLQGATPTIIQVVGSSGSVLVSSSGLDPQARLCGDAASPGTDRVSLTLGGRSGSYLRTVQPVSTPEFTALVCAVTSDQPVQKAQEAVILALLIALPLLAAGGSLVVWLAVGRALRAVYDMTSQAEAMQSTSDGELTVPQTRDEIQHLARTLNALLHRLHLQTRTTRQFVADAGHELRNPLSTLRVTLEFADDTDATSLRSSMQSAIRDLDRLEELVEDLLALARADSPDMPLEFESVDLATLVTDSVSAAARMRSGIDVSVDFMPCIIQGNPKALRGLMTNLMDNAIRHARTTITVHLQTDGRTTRIEVDDDGEGLREGDCERVFERFVRLDESRDRDEGGSGLGLAIVASVAQLHGGRVWAIPGPGGHFRVELPS